MKFSLNKKHFKILIIVASVIAIFSFINFSSVKVKSYTIKKGEISSVVMGTGTLDAKLKMIISSKISERIEKIIPDQGSSVKKGDLLTLLDDSQLSLQCDVAEAEVQTAKASVKKAHSDVASNKAILEYSQILYDRYKHLRSKDAVSQEKLDSMTEDLGTAEGRYSSSKLAVIEADKKVIEANKNLQYRKSQLEDSKIIAPFDGLIISRDKDPGDMAIPGTSIMTLISTDVIWVSAWVGETQLNKIKLGQKADIVFRSNPNKKFKGTVARIANKVDSETREFLVDIKIDKLPKQWAIGQRAEVYINTLTKNDAISVPTSYIKYKDDKPGVFKDIASKAVWAPITLGVTNNQSTEVLSGLNVNDRIVCAVSDKQELKNNKRIKLS